MKPVNFPQTNVTFAADQPEYIPLPAFSDERETISCYALTWRERWAVLSHGRLWLRQLNFGQPLQPQRIQVEPVRFGYAHTPSSEVSP